MVYKKDATVAGVQYYPQKVRVQVFNLIKLEPHLIPPV